MSFGNVYASFLFLPVIGLFLFHLVAGWRMKRASEILASRELFSELTSAVDRKRQRMKGVLFFAALIFSVAALMRPQFGFHWAEGKRRGLDILFAIDTSRSMLAEDVKPNRVERAKGMVRDFLEKLKGDRVGLIAFSGSAFLACPLTVDYGAFRLLLESLDVDSSPKGGTALSTPIREALKAYGGQQAKYGVLFLLTDGEDHAGDWTAAVEMARKEGLKIFCVGMGTKGGDLIPVINEDGRREFLRDRQGQVIKSRLDEGLLRKIASITGGRYARAGQGEGNLEWMYEEDLAKLEKGEFQGPMRKHHKEWYQLFLSIALLFLVLELLIDERKKTE